jgi:hypothetical protein
MKQYAEEARILVNNWRAEIDINADEKIWLRALQDRLAESLECAYRDGFVRGTKESAAFDQHAEDEIAKV